MPADVLFDLADIPAPTTQPEVPRYVVDINEILLFTFGGTTPEAREWWAVEGGRPGIAARTTYLGIYPAGAHLYLACEDKEEATFLRDYIVAKGCNPKAVTVRKIGHTITCAGCGERRPYWVSYPRTGTRCRPCHDKSRHDIWPGGRR